VIYEVSWRPGKRRYKIGLRENCLKLNFGGAFHNILNPEISFSLPINQLFPPHKSGLLLISFIPLSIKLKNIG
jgi:hypothetical protein